MKAVLSGLCLAVLAGCAVPYDPKAERRVCVEWSSICYFSDGSDSGKGPPAY